MFSQFYCAAHQHNPWLVLLAVLVCAFASATSLRLLVNAGHAKGHVRIALLLVSGACGGTGTWATHFIAMLAFRPGAPTAYDVSGTLISLAIAVFGGAAGVLLTVSTPARWRSLTWGAAFALGAGSMHYVGMAALRLPGFLSWNPALVAASFCVGGIFADLALVAAMRTRSLAGFAASTALMVVAVCSLHFLGMAAITITLNPGIAVPVDIIPHQVLAMAVGALTVVIAMICLLSVWIEARGQQKSLQLTRSIVDSVPQAVAYFDADDRYVLGNEAFVAELAAVDLEPRTGVTYETILRRVASGQVEGISPEDREAWIGGCLEARRESASASDQQMTDGRFLRIESKRTTLGGLVTVISDITGLKRQADDLAAARDLAQAANTAKSEFLANMSHEIRTPMNGVIGVAELLAMEALTPKQAELVSLLRASSGTLQRLLSDVLDIAKVEAGVLEIEETPFDLLAMAEDVFFLFSPNAGKEVAARLEVTPAEPGRFIGDEVRIKQVLGNLLSNAIKFTAKGHVHLGITVEADMTVFTVTDTGIGFDPADKERLFARFEQADGSITRRFGGTGLGLFICRDLASRMGGTLDCESTPGAGSVFTLTLPLRRADAEASIIPPLAVVEPDLEAAFHFLIVDDNPTNQRVLALILEGAGIRSTMADNGQEAVERFRSTPFDAVLMDMQMPVMDGLTATRTIRALETKLGRAPTPIIMVSANTLPEHVNASLDAGANGYVAKPVTPARLFEALGRLDDDPQLDTAAARAA